MASGTRSVDVVVVGAGTAGMAAYRAATDEGARTLLVESRAYGTTCARVGCMPSKLLIAAADAAHAVENAHRFGIGAPARAVVDGVRVMERVRSERDRFVGFVLRTVETFPAEDRLLGEARFVSDDTLKIGDDLITAKAVVIATGSRAARAPMFNGLGDRLCTSDDVFSWLTLPRSIAVFGPGLIGLELGQALSRLGVRVHLFGSGGPLGPLTDPKLQEETANLIAPDVGMHGSEKVHRIVRTDDGVTVTFSSAQRERTEHFDLVLAATGRVPNVEFLGLGTTHLTCNAHGVPLFDRTTMQCGKSAIFIAGDASVDVPLLHEAQDQGFIAGKNAARFPDVTAGLRRSALSIVFTDPQLARVGETWEQVKDRDPVVGQVSFDDQGRSRVLLVNHGRLHVYVDATTGRLLGAEMIGPAAEHLAHLLAWAHQLELTVPAMLELPYFHPVIEEGLRTALRDASKQLAQRAAGAASTDVASEVLRAAKP
jgi:dihydrolipoamide dehydrogenase